MTNKKQKEIADEIRSRYTIGDCLIQEDFEFMLSIFKQHDAWGYKSRLGVNNIKVKKAGSGFKNTCFAIVDDFGGVEDISVKKALKKQDISHYEKVSMAGRVAIMPEKDKVKRKVIPGVSKCALTGELLYKCNLEIDHYNLKYAEMLKLWLKDKDLYKIEVYRDAKKWNFDNHLLKLDFIRFHNMNCNLRAVTADANKDREKK